MFALSSVAWSVIGNAASIAASPRTCQKALPTTEPEPKDATRVWGASLPNSLENARDVGTSDASTQLELQPPTGLPLPSRESDGRNIPLACSSTLQPAIAQEGLDAPQAAADPELGILRVRELEVKDGNWELGILRVRKLEVQDSGLELGNLRLRDLEVQPPHRSQPTAHLLARVSYFQTNNMFSGVDPVDGGLISSGLTFWAAPALGPKTNFVAVIDGNLIRYVDKSQFNYNQLRFRAGIRQRLTSRMYGEIGWNNQQLFRASVGERFLNEHSIRLALYRRDRLTDRLRLDSLYEFRLSNANPDSRSRMINSLSVSLSYYIQRNFEVGFDYQFGLSNFTQRARQDQYHRLLTRLTYAVSRDSQISVQGGLSLGGSSDPNIDFDNLFFSVTYTVELGKF